jgi:hypothetical protein
MEGDVMVEIFQGAPAEVKRQANKWCQENDDMAIEYVLQDVIGVDLVLTFVYSEPYKGEIR